MNKVLSSRCLKSIIAFLVVAGTVLSLLPVYAQSASVNSGEYLLGPEDIIEVTVRNHSQLNQIITIRPDGKITFPRAGELQAAGITAQALGKTLQSQLSRSLNNVKVDVSVKESHSRRVRMLGAIKSAGSYQLRPESRFMDVVALAGGLSTRATRISGRIIRDGRVIQVNVERAVLHPEGPANVPLMPNDLVILDEKIITKQINVIGEVKNPGAFDLEENLTVISLLTQAGGPNEQAALKNIHVLRAGKQIPLDAYETLTQGKSSEAINRFQFQAGDVLVVPQNEHRYGVMGEVSKPAYYSLPENRSEATVLKALAFAGGPSQDGDLEKASITRIVEGKATVLPVNLRSLLEGTSANDIELQPDDILLIPKRNNRVHVIGQVGKPGAFDLTDSLTLLSLLSEAGSPINGAGLSKSYILRGETQLPINLHSVLVNGQADDDVSKFKLQNGDVLVIPDVTNQVHVIGQVSKPGAYNLDDNLSVVSLLAAVGSPTSKAALKESYVLRAGAQVPLNLYSLLAENKPAPEVANFKFQPGDVLVVPENDALFGILGQVSAPGYFPVPEKSDGATILKALAMAGGPTAEGNLKEAGLIRSVNGEATVTPINIDEMLKKGAMDKNISLMAGDVLYIPSRKKGFDWKSILSIVPFFGMF